MRQTAYCSDSGRSNQEGRPRGVLIVVTSAYDPMGGRHGHPKGRPDRSRPGGEPARAAPIARLRQRDDGGE
jgi:hypothetical protein